MLDVGITLQEIWYPLLKKLDLCRNLRRIFYVMDEPEAAGTGLFGGNYRNYSSE
jgi:hypothetical protein